MSDTPKKKATKKKAKNKSAKKTKSQTGESPELDAREAARALKRALAESESETDGPAAHPRRRRPPTSHGHQVPRPVRRRRPTPPPEPPDPKLAPPTLFARHDLTVILLGLALLAAGSLAHRSLTAVTIDRLETLGLALDRPRALLPATAIPSTPAGEAGDGSALPYHVEYQSPTRSLLRLEILVEPRPTYNNLHAARALDRVSRYGEIYWSEPTESVKIGGRNWLRTQFRYGYKTNSFDSPDVATGVEFATLNGGLLYVVTSHGTPDEASELAALIEPTLTADANHPAASSLEAKP